MLDVDLFLESDLESFMRASAILPTFGVAIATALTVGCSAGAAVAPEVAAGQTGGRFALARTSLLSDGSGFGHKSIGYLNCPPHATLKYLADYNWSVVNVYAGKFAGQSPCGQITAGLGHPTGLYVDPRTHDLYVANSYGFMNTFDILVFHRGWLTPYNGYKEPNREEINDVTVARDGTIVAINIGIFNGSSISTWIPSPTGGTFVGYFPIQNGGKGLYIASKKDGKLYYDDIDSLGNGSLWSVSCPAGACGVQTQVAGITFGNFPAGIKFDTSGDLLVNDAAALTADTFELPNPKPKTFPLSGVPVGLAVDPLENHWFVADPTNNVGVEYLYPSGVLVGTVPGNPSGALTDIAVDP